MHDENDTLTPTISQLRRISPSGDAALHELEALAIAQLNIEHRLPSCVRQLRADPSARRPGLRESDSPEEARRHRRLSRSENDHDPHPGQPLSR